MCVTTILYSEGIAEASATAIPKADILKIAPIVATNTVQNKHTKNFIKYLLSKSESSILKFLTVVFVGAKTNKTKYIQKIKAVKKTK